MKTNILILSATLLLGSTSLYADQIPATPQRARTDAPAAEPETRAPQPPAHLVTVLVPALEDTTARAVVVRRPSVPRNVILVTAETTPGEFLAALRALNRSRRDVGERPDAELRASIRANPRRTSPGETALARAAEHLSWLKSERERPIAGVGSYPAVTTALQVVQR